MYKNQSHAEIAVLETEHQQLTEIETIFKPRKTFNEYALDGLSGYLVELRSTGMSSSEIYFYLRQCKLPFTKIDLFNYLSKVIDPLLDQSNCKEKSIQELRIKFIENGLRTALHEGKEISVFYQPQIDAQTGVVCGAEALLRWEHQGENISPVEFIPVAERTDLIIDLGRWALRNACKEAKRWRNLGLGKRNKITVGVNVSTKQCTTSLPHIVSEALNEADLQADDLDLEITESFSIDEGSREILKKLKLQGVSLSLDDFGTGYSCLAVLHELPLNTIKIDRAFVSRLNASKKSALLIKTISDLARNFGMRTLAEGVETEIQANRLRELGCDALQGFLYSPALSSDDFVNYVRALDN